MLAPPARSLALFAAARYASTSSVTRRSISRSGITPRTSGTRSSADRESSSAPARAFAAACAANLASMNARFFRYVSVRARLCTAWTRALCAYFRVRPLVRVPLGHGIVVASASLVVVVVVVVWSRAHPAPDRCDGLFLLISLVYEP